MTSSPSFRWPKFYMEFADRLLEHKDNRESLVAKVRQVCNDLGHHYLDNSATARQNTGLPDICPFTTMGTFNRGISLDNRRRIATDIGQFLGVTADVPNSLDGIPTLNNLNSVVFWDLRYIDPLWRVFEDAIRFADSDNEDNQQAFLKSYDQILKTRGVGRKLTIGLFWARPSKFLTLDSSSEGYISSILGVKLPSRMPPPGREYLRLRDQLRQRFRDSAFPVHSFEELSLEAYESATTGSRSQVWLVRAGRNGEFEDAALQEGQAIVDFGVPDLTDAETRDAVRDRVQLADPNASPYRVGNITGQLVSFLLDMEEGDVVVLPLKTRKGLVALGRVAGPYVYRGTIGADYHTRRVNWIREGVPTSEFGALWPGIAW